MVCVSPEAGPVVESSVHAFPRTQSATGFASAARGYSSNLAADLKEGLQGSFIAPQVEDRVIIEEMRDPSASVVFELARCGDSAINVIGDYNSTEETINAAVPTSWANMNLPNISELL